MSVVILAELPLPSFGRCGMPVVVVKRFECRLVHAKVNTRKKVFNWLFFYPDFPAVSGDNSVCRQHRQLAFSATISSHESGVNWP